MNLPADLSARIADRIRAAHNNQVYDEVLFNAPELPVLKNEYLLFLKPEITMPDKKIRLEAIIDLVFDQLERFGMVVHDIRILASDYIEKFNLIDQHYGVISNISNYGRNAMTESARIRFREIYGVEADQSDVIGGIEFLRRYPFFNYHSLNCLWQNFEDLKLASGTYVEKLKVDKETVYVLNAFHPKQLRHFTEPGRSIVLFNVSGDGSWKDARRRFIGATDPNKAESGSLRRLFLERRQELCIPEISQSLNGVHLSAGPVEGLIELHRFDSDHSSPEGEADYQDFSFGRQLIEVFGEIPEDILANATLEVDGRLVTVFDLTEEMDAEEALECLKKVLKPTN